MLPDWMIEELEKDRRRGEERDRPRLELELPRSEPRCPRRPDDVDEIERGVVIIQII